MAEIKHITLTASGTVIIPLVNHRKGTPNTYTVQLANNFGSGTVTAFTNPEGAATAALGTTYDIPITNSAGVAIAATTPTSFNFECNSAAKIPTVLKLILAGSTSPSLVVRVDNSL